MTIENDEFKSKIKIDDFTKLDKYEEFAFDAVKKIEKSTLLTLNCL